MQPINEPAVLTPLPEIVPHRPEVVPADPRREADETAREIVLDALIEPKAYLDEVRVPVGGE